MNHDLTAREIQVCDLVLGHNYTLAQAAERLGVSHDWARRLMSDAYVRMCVTNRREAWEWWREHGCRHPI